MLRGNCLLELRHLPFQEHMPVWVLALHFFSSGMAASKKTFPLSRLCYPRSRKNGLIDSHKQHYKSSLETNSSSQRNRHYPSYFTVDDLALYRRKRIPVKQLDTLRPLSGKFCHLKSEYKKKFRSFVIAPDESAHWKRRKMKIFQHLDLGKEDATDTDDTDLPRPVEKSFPSTPINQLENKQIGELHTAEVSDANHKDNCCAMLKQARRAVLTRYATNLKVEGEFTDVTENKERFKQPPIGSHKRELLRRNTILKLDGGMDFLTETHNKYIEYENVHRRKLLRRHTIIEIPKGCFDTLSEYNVAFGQIPQPTERHTLSRSVDNLHMQGDMEFDVEYRRSFIDYHTSYPDIIFKSRKYETRPRGQVTTCGQVDLKELLLDKTWKSGSDFNSGYERSRAPSFVQCPSFKRPHINLPTASFANTKNKESQLKAKFKPLEAGKRNHQSRPVTQLHLEGKTDFTLDYRRSFLNFSDCRSNNKNESFNFIDSIESKKNRSANKIFQKGKRHSPGKSTAEGIYTSSHEKPSFRLEVTNPDHVHKPFEQTKPSGTSFIVLNENNNYTSNRLSRPNRRWAPSWAKA